MLSFINILYCLPDMTSVDGFYARIGQFVGSGGQDTSIPFDIDVASVGNGYNPISGHYTAPVDGLYSISFEVMAWDGCAGAGNYLCGLLYVGNVVKSESCSIFPNSAGTSLTLHLLQGEAARLAIKATAPCLTTNGNDNDNKFSGHLVYQVIKTWHAELRMPFLSFDTKKKYNILFLINKIMFTIVRLLIN